MRHQISVVLALIGLWSPGGYTQGQNAKSASPRESVGPSATAPRDSMNPPKVSCHGNTLSISARSSTLGSILIEVEKCTGVHFDYPPAAADELVFDEIGPGPSRDVVSSLLTSSGFDFVLGAASSDPERIEKVVLLARTRDADGGSGDVRRSTPLRSAFAQMRDAARPKPPEVQAAAAGIKPADADASVSPDAATESGDPDSTAPKPHASTTDTSDGAASETGSTGAAPSKEKSTDEKPTSPAEEKIVSMEKLFEQRRQMMQPAQAPRQTAPQP